MPRWSPSSANLTTGGNHLWRVVMPVLAAGRTAKNACSTTFPRNRPPVKKAGSHGSSGRPWPGRHL